MNLNQSVQDAFDDTVAVVSEISNTLKNEVSQFIESLTPDPSLQDPVFEGMVRQFFLYDQQVVEVLDNFKHFINCLESLSEATLSFSSVILETVAHNRYSEPSMKTDSTQYRETIQQVCQAASPHASIAKFKRDAEFNLIVPLTKIAHHNEELKDRLKTRKRRLIELASARRSLDITKSDPSRSDRLPMAKATYDSALIRYNEIDGLMFEWLLMIEKHNNDFMDSLLQTVKYVQYTFFSSLSHGLGAILPARMEFRPLLEMTPEAMEPLVVMELEEMKRLEESELANLEVLPRLLPKKSDIVGTSTSPKEQTGLLSSGTSREAKGVRNVDVKKTGSSSAASASDGGIIGGGRRRDATNRIILKWQAELDEQIEKMGDRSDSEDEEKLASVDALSLSVLMSQGFEEKDSRKALRKFDNDLQESVDYLVSRPKETPSVIKSGDEFDIREVAVRLPTSLRWVRKLKEKKRKSSPKKSKARDKDAPVNPGNPLPAVETDVSSTAVVVAPSVEVNDLLGFSEEEVEVNVIKDAIPPEPKDEEIKEPAVEETALLDFL